MVEMKQISRVGSREDRLNTDMGSVARKPENFACKDASEKALPSCSFASFGVSLRALSGASCDASEEVSVFRPRRYLERSAAPQEFKVRCFGPQDIVLKQAGENWSE